MLGEDHSLAHEFPAYRDTIARLIENDPDFAKDAKQYHSLDREIRELELNGAPISDDEMLHKKHDRAVLKDSLYERLVAAGN